MHEINNILEYLEKIGKTTRWVNGREMPVGEIARKRSGRDEFGSTHDFKLILADACLAWRNPYQKKVIPRLKFISRQYAHIKTLEDLKELIYSLGIKFNDDFWNFNSQRRKEMFTALVTDFIEFKKRTGYKEDLEAMQDWARKAKPENHTLGIIGRKITCLGIANFQYLRMLCGVDTIKPDSHILQGIEEALGYKKRPYEAIRLIEKVSAYSGMSMLEIDQMLWVYFADKVPDFGWQDALVEASPEKIRTEYTRDSVSLDKDDIIDRIRTKLLRIGGKANIPYLKGDETFTAEYTQEGVIVNNLGNSPFLPWAVFSETARLLRANGGQADRGDAMNYKLGEKGLALNSVEGHIAQKIYGKRIGDSVFRRITPIIRIMIWAGICTNASGKLALN